MKVKNNKWGELSLDIITFRWILLPIFFLLSIFIKINFPPEEIFKRLGDTRGFFWIWKIDIETVTFFCFGFNWIFRLGIYANVCKFFISLTNDRRIILSTDLRFCIWGDTSTRRRKWNFLFFPWETSLIWSFFTRKRNARVQPSSLWLCPDPDIFQMINYESCRVHNCEREFPWCVESWNGFTHKSIDSESCLLA